MRSANFVWSRGQAILEHLSGREFTSRQELAQFFDVSPRQITRIIASLNDSGHQIEVNQRLGYRLLPQVQCIPLELTPAEVFVLLMVFQMTPTGLSSQPRALWNGMVEKIKRRLSTSSRTRLNKLQAQVVAVSSPSDEESYASQFFSAIESSISRKVRLRIEYWSIDDSEPRWREVEPLGLFLSRAWYLQAFDLESRQQKTYRLTRISNASITDIPVSEAANIPIQSGFQRWSLVAGPDYSVQIQVDPKLRRWLKENPVHPFQRLEDNLLHFEAKELDRVVDWTLSVRGARLIGPPELLDKMRERLAQLSEVYGDTRCPSSL